MILTNILKYGKKCSHNKISVRKVAQKKNKTLLKIVKVAQKMLSRIFLGIAWTVLWIRFIAEGK